MLTRVFLLVVVAVFSCAAAFAMCGMCGPDSHGKAKGKDVFLRVAGEASVKSGVKEISYGQFMEIRKSGGKYTLLDVLPADSYRKGHIEGAVSFPVDTIDLKTAGKMLPEGGHAIVYCGSFQCGASTEAARKLSALGYEVIDYKGGLEEWQAKGNKLVS